MLVCVAYPQLRQSWLSFRAPGPRASARRGEKGSPRFRSGTVRLLFHLVLWSSLGTLGQHRPHIEVHLVRSNAALRSSSPKQRSRCPAVGAARGGVTAQCAHGVAIAGGKWGVLLLLLRFLSLYTILEHHNVAQSNVSPQPPSPSHPRSQIASSTAPYNRRRSACTMNTSEVKLFEIRSFSQCLNVRNYTI